MTDPENPARTLFVTATDTGVGKTFVACALARSLRERGRDVGVMKPVATGCRRLPDGTLESEDARALVEASGADDAPGLVSPAAFEPPLAPSAAARKAGGDVDVSRILHAYGELCARHEFLIVEGIGGILVPLSARFTVRDLAKEMGSPVVIISRNALGAINHTALTVASARAGGLEVRGVVLNSPPGLARDESAESNAREIEALTGARVLLTLPGLAGSNEAAERIDASVLGEIFADSEIGDVK